MKNCPNCNAQIEDDALFCIHCGTKIDAVQPDMKICSNCGAEIPQGAKFCPECAAEQQEQGIEIDPFGDWKPREFVFECLYGCDVEPSYPGKVIINPVECQFKTIYKGLSVLFAIRTWGTKANLTINIKDITHMSIMERGYLLFVRTSDGATHIFAGPNLRLRANKLFVKRMAYILELFRRMYWYYTCRIIPYVDGFRDAVELLDHNNLSDVELIKFVNEI